MAPPVIGIIRPEEQATEKAGVIHCKECVMEQFLSTLSAILIAISVPLVFFYFIKKPKSGERKKTPVYVWGVLAVMVMSQLAFFLYHAHRLYERAKSIREHTEWRNEQNRIG